MNDSNNRFQGTLHKVSGPLNRDVGHKKMKRTTIALILWALAAGTVYAADEEPWYQKLVTDRYPPKVRAILLPVASGKAKVSFNDDTAQWQYIYAYMWGYVHGLENISGTMGVGKTGSPHQMGFDAGLMDYQDHSGETNHPLGLVDYGYEPVTATGIYESGFENSRFVPNGSQEKWWGKFQVGVIDSYAEKQSISKHGLFINPRACTFKGYLAPIRVGGTGHMNQYDRDFIITEILDIGPEPSTKDVNVEIK